ncbi:ral-GDS-related protein-like [Panthera tigris]|uniref:ral-GDS-related protein-like n=1 Tax=Panthera tigris TaxID=9694 RepID=UPI001C6FC28A|nr:ral-GDS-related protein-like [Panthera tigris]
MSLVPAHPSRNITYITTFLDPYEVFTSSQKILDHLFNRESYEKFKELCSQDKSLNREMMTKCLKSSFRSNRKMVCKAGYRMDLGGGKINLKKRNEEYKAMREILLLQMAANNYNLNPKEEFGAWFQDTERLSENERSWLQAMRHVPGKSVARA